MSTDTAPRPGPDERARQAVRDGDVAGLIDALNLEDDSHAEAREQIAAMANDWTATAEWVTAHPELAIGVAAGLVHVYDLDEATAREVLLCDAPPGSVVRKERPGYVDVIRYFGQVEVVAIVRLPKPSSVPVVLNPETAA